VTYPFLALFMRSVGRKSMATANEKVQHLLEEAVRTAYIKKLAESERRMPRKVCRE
jgi:hypothetical protein